MKIINYLDNLIIQEKTAVALGNFDGIHLGHKLILEDAINVAKEKNLKSLCFTFSNTPFNYFIDLKNDGTNQIKRLCTETDKIKIIENMGFDYLVNVPFDEKIKDMSASKFLTDVVSDSLSAAVISVGFNYTYGINAEGDSKQLYKDGSDLGMEVRVHDAVKVYHNVVSSTLIRETISSGDMELAAMYLGREYSLFGKVISGNKRGVSMGFPTVNFPVDDELVLPPNGVYGSRIIIDNIEYRSVTNIGTRPTVDGQNKMVETHIFDFNQDVYNKNVTVILERFIREEKKFNSLDELKEQISEDIKNINKNY